MIADDKGQRVNRIPISFIDEEADARDEERADASGSSAHDGGLTSDELGRQSSYEDETEMQRRIDHGGEDETVAGRDDADDADTAGGTPLSEVPERREDQDEAGAGPAKDMQSDDRDMQSDDSETGFQAAPPPRVADAHGPAVAELVATRAELKRVENERTELLDRLARRQADFDNYRKRLERERAEMYGRTVGEVVGKLLPVLDNLGRALDAETSVEASESEEFRRFLHGVELIYKQLNDVLAVLGLEPVESVGHRFDPHVHEAVATEASDEFEPDTVTQEIIRGYRLGEKLLRPAMVKVATKP